MSYRGYVSVTKSLGEDETPDVHLAPRGTAFVRFGAADSDGTGGVELMGPLEDMAVALDRALTDVQALIDARED